MASPLRKSGAGLKVLGKLKGATKALARGRKKRIDIGPDAGKIDQIEGDGREQEEIKVQLPPPIELPPFQFPQIPKIPNWKKFAWQGGLQATIDKAPAESTIEVPAGTYEESARIEKSLHLIGIGTVTIASDTQSDTVWAEGELVILENFKFTMETHQAFGTCFAAGGEALFKGCTFESNHTYGMTVKAPGRAYLVDCSVSSNETWGVVVRKDSSLVAENCHFGSNDKEAIIVRGNAVARLSNCTGQTNSERHPAFNFLGEVTYLFENSTISTKVGVKSHGNKPLTNDVSLTLFRNCDIQGENLVVMEGATCYCLDCRFHGQTLEVKDKAGVRVKGTTFSDHDKPVLLVSGPNATVEVNESTFSNLTSPAGVVACNGAKVRFYDSKFVDLSGCGIFALHEKIELLIERCGFGNIAGTGVIAQSPGTSSGFEVTVTNSLFEQIGGVGLLLSKVVKAEVKGSKFAKCSLSGVEVNEVPESTFQQCVFDSNSQCGVVVFAGKISVTSCDFIKNHWTGLDLRGQVSFEISDCLAVGNPAGGFAFRGAKGKIEKCEAGGNQQYGLSAFAGSVVEGDEITLVDCDGLAALAIEGGNLTLEKCTITRAPGVAILGDGEESKLVIRETTLEDNKVGMQAIGQSSLTVENCTFQRNGIHLDSQQKATVNVNNTRFSETIDGLGVHVHGGSVATFTGCELSAETQAALATDSRVEITTSTITGCMRCGLYWYGDASGEIKGCTIENNGSCGIQIMGGQATVVGNTVTGHNVFGIHVNTGATLVENGDNILSANTKKDINYE